MDTHTDKQVDTHVDKLVERLPCFPVGGGDVQDVWLSVDVLPPGCQIDPAPLHGKQAVIIMH